MTPQPTTEERNAMSIPISHCPENDHKYRGAEVRPEDLVAVEFSRSGLVTAASAAYVGDATSGGVPVWIRHPSGGSVLVSFESTLGFAEDLVETLNNVLAAWARLR